MMAPPVMLNHGHFMVFYPWRRRHHYHPPPVVVVVALMLVGAAIVAIMLMHDHHPIDNVAMLHHIDRHLYRMAYRGMVAAAQQRRTGQQRNNQFVHGILPIANQG
jgi:hypothetical protein